jgi:iron complex transport system ATP-binding protein
MGDTDQKVGKNLGLPMAVEEPFSPISPRGMEENRRLIDRADLVLVERFHVGPGNLENLRAALEALEKGKRVIVLDNNLEYDLTGGEARACYGRLREGGAVFLADHSGLLEAAEVSRT